MISSQIVGTVKRVADAIKHTYNPFDFNKNTHLDNKEKYNDVVLLINDVIETGNRIELLMLQQYAAINRLDAILDELDFPIILFENRQDNFYPVIAEKKNGKRILTRFISGHFEETDYTKEALFDVITKKELGDDYDSQIIFLTPASLQPLVSYSKKRDSEYGETLSPMQRLFMLLKGEKKDIYYIYIYAVIIGIFSLTLPIGVQAIINFVSGGLIFNSVALLIFLVILGVLVSGVLQIMQMALVEVLQRRIFAKAAYEFAYRIPKIRIESIFKVYAPELMNRFFDILTLQKGLPKLLIDLTQAFIQILFGLILLSFYHPFFVLFGILLFTILFLILYLTGPKGLHSSLQESKYKYKIAHWLEELARTLIPFKLAGFTNLPIQKMDYYLNGYLKSRKIHFKVLITQYSYIIVFKTVIIGGILIMGSLLVIDKQITIGQFVATEIVILMIINAVEKIIMSMDVVYDMLTAVDKIGYITDLPLERDSGVILSRANDDGLALRIRDLNYSYPESSKKALENINFEVPPGHSLGISGYNESGKFTLVQVISGILQDYEGIVTLNNLSLRDIDLNSLRDNVGKYAFKDDIFEGTIYDNIAMGISRTGLSDVLWAIDKVGLSDIINALPQGLNTQMVAAGKGFSTNVIKRIVLARAIAEKPKLLLLNDFLGTISIKERTSLLNFLFDKRNHWTLVCISNDPVTLTHCDSVVVMNAGKVICEGQFKEISKNPAIKDMFMISNE